MPVWKVVYVECDGALCINGGDDLREVSTNALISTVREAEKAAREAGYKRTRKGEWFCRDCWSERCQKK